MSTKQIKAKKIKVKIRWMWGDGSIPTQVAVLDLSDEKTLIERVAQVRYDMAYFGPYWEPGHVSHTCAYAPEWEGYKQRSRDLLVALGILTKKPYRLRANKRLTL